MWPVFQAFMLTPRFVPVKGSVDLNTKNNCQTEKKTLRNIDTKNTYLNDAFENGAISVYKCSRLFFVRIYRAW